jgi:hypothetical protein
VTATRSPVPAVLVDAFAFRGLGERSLADVAAAGQGERSQRRHNYTGDGSDRCPAGDAPALPKGVRQEIDGPVQQLGGEFERLAAIWSLAGFRRASRRPSPSASGRASPAQMRPSSSTYRKPLFALDYSERENACANSATKRSPG